MIDFQFLRKFFFVLSCLSLILFSIVGPIKVSAADKSLPRMFEEALSLSQNGDFPNALELWNEFLEESPADPLGLSNRGNIRLILGDLEGAIADQTKSIELLPSEPDPYVNRGIAEEALARLDDAEKDYKWVLDNYQNLPRRGQ